MRCGLGHDLFRRAGNQQPSAAVAAFGAQVDDPVRRADHVEVVLDDEQRVPRVEQALERAEQLRDVVEVQAGGRLVEQEQRRRRVRAGPPCGWLHVGKVPRELQPLGFAAGQRRHRLAESQVVETDRGERLEPVEHFAVVREEDHGFGDGQLQHVGDAERLALVATDPHFEDFRAETLAVAVRAAQVHVGEELHLDVLEAVAAAGGAAPVAGIEAEGAERVAALHRDGIAGKALADRVERADVARGVRAGRAADLRLVDHHDFADEVRAFERLVRTWRLGGLAVGAAQARVEHVLHQRGLARTRHARHADQTSQWNLDVEVLEVVLRRATDPDRWRTGLRRTALAGCRHCVEAARQVLRRERVGARRELGGRALEHDLAAVLTGAGPHVDDAVGRQHDLRVVLDDEQRVAVVAQAVHHFDHAAHVARMQADRRLVEHEQRVDQRRAERRRQVDALDFATRQRARLTVERQVPEAHADQEAEPRANLAEQLVRGFVERCGQCDALEERQACVERQQHQLVDVEAGAGCARSASRHSSASSLSRAPWQAWHGV